MAANTSVSLDKWRDYFRSANSDIFAIIEYAIMVAASDCPYEFKLKRDRIAEALFSCKFTKCFGCDRIELAVPNPDGFDKTTDDKCKSGVEPGGSKDTKESKVNSSSRDDDDVDDHTEVMEINVNHISAYSYGDAEALTDEIEEESLLFGEVLRIKQILDNYQDESDSLLFDSLRKLQLMPLSVETLKATEIGISVNGLRKHGSKEIRNLIKALIGEWKVMVDSWVNATAAIADAENAPESVKTSAVEEEEEEEGLPSPPLDEGAFFATPTSMELSQFFDGMDDDGNPRNNGEFDKNRGSSRKPAFEEKDTRNRTVGSSPDNFAAHPKDRKAEIKRNNNQDSTLKKQSNPSKPNRPPIGESGPGRPKPPTNESGPGRPKPALNKPKINNEIKVEQKFDKGRIQKKPAPPQQNKQNNNNEASVTMNLEVAKRKLQERYQEAENAKRQRTIQVVELRDLPKQSLTNKNNNQHMRHGNHNRRR